AARDARQLDADAGHAAPAEDVEVVERAGAHAHAHLARSGRRIGEVAVAQDLRTAVLLEEDGLHRDSSTGPLSLPSNGGAYTTYAMAGSGPALVKACATPRGTKITEPSPTARVSSPMRCVPCPRTSTTRRSCESCRWSGSAVRIAAT